ncbi:hypothetical protein [Aquimarina agarivorans]|uniref:hypothetical protein n=1 Tax=Aquimarina agarivorans TaxID=980584 RepID=UPI000248EFE6|nr:hypothetical protein [Aquimarina agarivorans]
MDSSTSTYKKLFEVQILHDYFLMDTAGVSFFNKNKVDRERLLSNKIENNSYNVNDLFSIVPTNKTKQILERFGLIYGTTPLGFFVGTEVTIKNINNEVLYMPFLDTDKLTSLAFVIQPQLPFFKSVTNISFSTFKPAIYYFTNTNKQVFTETELTPSFKSFPLTNTPLDYQDGICYEMGALSKIEGNLKEAQLFTNNKADTDWKMIKDKRVVSDADKTLLPSIFDYTFKKVQNIKDVEFILEDKSGGVVKSIQKTSDNPITKVPINFKRVNENDVSSNTISSGFYNLKIVQNKETILNFPIHINDDLYDKNNFGVLEIHFKKENSPFSILDIQGFLKTKIDNNGEKIQHPVFEIRFKNRNTYWRYNKSEAFSPSEVSATASFLTQNNAKLISKDTKSLTDVLVPFMNGSSLMLPHPKTPNIKIENDKIFSEIYISQSNRLLNS